MIFSCCTHIAAAEFIPIERSKGEVLKFRRNVAHLRSAKDDVEDAATSIEASAFASTSKGARNKVIEPTTSTHPMENLWWDNLNYDVRTGHGSKRILYDLEGWVKQGKLTALMVSDRTTVIP